MQKHVLFVTSTNLASNPRCLKEIKLLYNTEVKITVVAFHLHNWTSIKEEELNKELNKINFHYIDATKADLMPWLWASLMEKLGGYLSKLFSKNDFIQSLAVGKRSWLLQRWFKKWDQKPDLIIAHNPAALYPSAIFAKKKAIPFAVDIEDYYPGEGNAATSTRSIAVLMQHLIPKTSYTSYAAPLIKKYTNDLLQTVSNSDIVINNTFSINDFFLSERRNSDDKIKFVWFSQFIDYGRGLEKVLPTLDDFANDIELTLIGSKREEFFNKEVNSRMYINHIASLSQADLNKELCRHDIGLAIEDSAADLNRNICLTNKIWAYLQAGLFIIASDTEAQQLFMEEHNMHGVVVRLNKNDLSSNIKNIIADKQSIQSNKQDRFKEAKNYSWENESTLLKTNWQSILQ
ncbi:glycosyltransferase family protein [Ferruginibacter albus]|uniref:hypothetical protein n=1 Tax=Ferruginibacter albus TaxID=2875540 RepID=UPI001CC608AE|nr:hypothetical protein [Ferruginibacter albus]UAY50679.1 hypothetical protein K9M53_08735 [Ferruginibacter albus]